MNEFEKALEQELKNYYGTTSSHEMVIGHHFAEWGFKWIDSRHLKAKWKLMQERDRLKKIIAKELNENDEFGCEYTYVNVLKDEVVRLREALELADTQFEGLRLGFEKHGTNINIPFHIDYCLKNREWLKQALEGECDEPTK